MLKPLYVIIWHLLHLFAALCELFVSLKISLHALLMRSYDRLLRSEVARVRGEHEILERCSKQLNKRPRHLCIIIAPESKQVDAKVLRRLFSYALTMEIEMISVYDTRELRKGYVDLKQLQTPVEVICEEATVAASKSVIWRQAIADNIKRDKRTKTNGYTNGNGYINANQTDQNTLEIRQITASDGHAAIAKVCRELYGQRNTSEVKELLNERSKLSERISKDLQQHLEINSLETIEPELGIIFSREMCTYGMLPWHIRFTEFHRLSSEQYFDASVFAEVLYKYSRCEQRWGV